MTKTSAWGEGSCTRSRGVSRLEGDPPRPPDCDASPTARFGGEGCRASGIRCEYVEESVPPPARPSPTSACTSSPRPQCCRERWINPLYTVSSPGSEASASYWSRCIGAILSHRRSRRGPRRGRGADSPTIAAGLRRHIRPQVPSCVVDRAVCESDCASGNDARSQPWQRSRLFRPRAGTRPRVV